MPTTKEPVGYESEAIELSGELSSALDHLVKAIAWSIAREAGRGTVTEKDMLDALERATKEVNDYLSSNTTIHFSVAKILEGVEHLAKKYKLPTAA